MTEAATLEIKADQHTHKTMLRVYDGAQKGATAFFRNRPLMETVLALIREGKMPGGNLLFHAVSLGAEPYSYAIHCHMQGLFSPPALRFFATDLNPNFLHRAKEARYPEAVLAHMTPREQAYFEPSQNGEVRVIDDIRRRIAFLPAQSFVDAAPEGVFDAVFVMNALTYVSEADQARAIDAIAGYNTRYLFLTAFHPDSIKADLLRNHYRPVTANIEAIHNHWHDRVMDHPAPRGSPLYSVHLPRFSKAPDYDYKFCAIFEKTSS